MSETNYVKKDTFEQMKTELHQLKSVERPAASRAIAEAREKGDLKENAEYDAAKEAQGMLEAKIKYLEGVIAPVRCVTSNPIADLFAKFPGHEEIKLKRRVSGNVLQDARDFQIIFIVDTDNFIDRIFITK